MASFQNIYEEYAQPVYRFLLSLTGNDDLAEELLSETFYQAFRHIDQFEGRCNLYTWLCQIGKNAWIKECRRNKRYREIHLDDLVIPDDQPGLEEAVINREMYRKVLKALQSLKDPYRDVFILHAIGEVKLKEIAFIYEKTESWARVTYFRAKQQIAQEVLK
ncbi:MAG: sigma-70 family RNA polymerase sigma factor [Oscillospiraceae bacterium]|nr:sigma-70 family RNA polymerase sigma factor [Oscillospiraceae bacterium]